MGWWWPPDDLITILWIFSSPNTMPNHRRRSPSSFRSKLIAQPNYPQLSPVSRPPAVPRPLPFQSSTKHSIALLSLSLPDPIDRQIAFKWRQTKPQVLVRGRGEPPRGSPIDKPHGVQTHCKTRHTLEVGLWQNILAIITIKYKWNWSKSNLYYYRAMVNDRVMIIFSGTSITLLL